MSQLQNINDFTLQMFQDMVFEQMPEDSELDYGDNSMVLNIANFGEELPENDDDNQEYELPDLHEYVTDQDETRVAEDIKNMPLIARLGILGAKIREDPTGWYYFCATKNAAHRPIKTYNTSTKYVNLAVKGKSDPVKQFTDKAGNIERTVENEASARKPFSLMAKYAVSGIAYINSTYSETVRKNCMRIVSSESAIDTTGIPYPVQIEKASPSFPFSIVGNNVSYNGNIATATHAVELRNHDSGRSYQYLFFENGIVRDSTEFAHMLKISDWPNLLWRETRNGGVGEHYLLPITSPATFKTWIFLQQYNKSLDVKQKIDKFSIQNYVAKFDYAAIDFNNWYGDHQYRKNLDGSEVCSQYRERNLKHGKYVEPKNVPLTIPTHHCKMQMNTVCSCFIYPGELLDNLRIPQEVILQNGKYVKKPVRSGKICFYCGIRVHGEKCQHPNHSKNLNKFVQTYSMKYKIDATINRTTCVDCQIIVRVERDGRRRPVYSNELVVTPEFFSSDHWAYIQNAYANGKIYIVNYPGEAAEVLKTVDIDNNLRVEFFVEPTDEKGQLIYSERLKPAVCTKTRCDKLMTLYINDKIASIIGSTCQPLQFPEGYVLTLVPTKSVNNIVDEALKNVSRPLSIYDQNMDENVLKDHRIRQERQNKRQATMLFASAVKRSHNSQDLDDEIGAAKKAEIRKEFIKRGT